MIMELYDYLFNLVGHLCHQKPERSFFFRDYQFPFYARCTGIILGFILGLIVVHLTTFFENYLIFILFVPMIVDGLVQKFTDYESNNLRRVKTGFIFAFASVNIYLLYVFNLKGGVIMIGFF